MMVSYVFRAIGRLGCESDVSVCSGAAQGRQTPVANPTTAWMSERKDIVEVLQADRGARVEVFDPSAPYIRPFLDSRCQTRAMA
ncbi:hypothetical protein So717_41670 [Roseobacter cerasinus]|uniref:Uncharacterized protein n=1 Tax=Roseobacter cerasinus TaxID=2602289 RepID=A0A640VXU0_9RHOB|nr:hypothetical protein So717_41670 [Roseobacter cerasinus]